MSKKEIARQYIDATLSLRDKEDKLSTALANLCEDNYFISVFPEDYRGLVDTLALEALGAEVIDWLDWWLYETNQSNSQVTINGVDITINSFDDLWEKVIDG